MEPSVLEQLRIDKDTPLDVSIDGDTLVIRPVRESRSERVRAAAMRVADRHATAFERLAK
jgi:antitoxin component of MazEF toxin-antitoxin module